MAIFPVFDPFFSSKMTFSDIFKGPNKKPKNPQQNFIYEENIQRERPLLGPKINTFYGKSKRARKDLNLYKVQQSNLNDLVNKKPKRTTKRDPKEPLKRGQKNP